MSADRSAACACDEVGLLPMQEAPCDGTRQDERCAHARGEIGSAAYAIPSYWPDDVVRARIKSLRSLPRPLSREDGLRLGAALEEAHRRRLSRV